MDNQNIDQLKKLAKVFNTDNVITSNEIEQVLQGIMAIMSSFRSENVQLTEENRKTFATVMSQIEAEYKKSISTLENKESKLSSSFEKEISKVQKKFEKELKKAQNLIDELQLIEIRDGKDADETKIVEDVLAKIKLPENKVLTAEEIKTELETLEGEGRLSAEAIKGLEKYSTQANLDRAISILDQRTQFLINKTGGSSTGSSMEIGNVITGATAGSVLFAGAGGVLAQDNANFFWDDTNNRLGLGTASPSTGLHAKIDAFRLAHPSYASSYYFDMDNNGGTVNMNAVGTGSYYLWKENGSSKMILDASGNLGIGTTAPSYNLQVHSTSGNSILGVDAYDNSTNGVIKFVRAGIDSELLKITSDFAGASTASGWSMNFYANTATPTMTIKNGNVGIGTVSPTGLLHIDNGTAGNNNLQIQFQASGGGNWAINPFIVGISNGGLSFVDILNNRTPFVINASANVGIGTTSPLAQLQINTSSASTIGQIIKGYASQTASLTEWQNSAGAVLARVDEVGDFVTSGSFYTDSGVANTSTGNNAFLGMVSTGPYITRNIADTNPALYVRQVHASSTGDILQLRNSANTSLFNVSYDGKVGIGTTTPKTLLTIGSANGGSAVVATNNKVWVKGEGAVSATTPQARIDVGFNDNPDYSAYFGSINDTYTTGAVLGTRSGGTDYATIYMKSGNVGIGTTSPGAQLQINTSSASVIGQIVKGYASQTADLTQWQNSAGTKLATVNAAGEIYLEVSGRSFGNNAGSFNLDAYSTSADTTVSVRNSAGSYIANLSVEGNISVGSTIRLKGYTVATLPTGTQGDTAFVTDALAPTFGATVVGGGAVVIKVFFDGTNWIVG